MNANDTGHDNRASFLRSLWPYAMRTAAFLKNRTYCTGALGATPFELFRIKKPDMHHMHSFGARAYAHIPRDKRPKMTQHCDVGDLDGYSEDEVGSYVYFPQFNCCRMIADVPGDESSFYRDRESSTSSSADEADGRVNGSDDDRCGVSESENKSSGSENVDADTKFGSGSYPSEASSEIGSDTNVDLNSVESSDGYGSFQ